MPHVAGMRRGSDTGSPHNAGHIMVDGVEYDVSNLVLSIKRCSLDQDRNTVPHYPHIVPSPGQPETRKRAGAVPNYPRIVPSTWQSETRQPRLTKSFHTSIPSKELLPNRANSCQGHYQKSETHPFRCSPISPNEEGRRKPASPPPPQASSSNNIPPPPPSPPSRDRSSPVDKYERRKHSIVPQYCLTPSSTMDKYARKKTHDSKYSTRSMRKSLKHCPSSSVGSFSSMGSTRSIITSPSSLKRKTSHVEIYPGIYRPVSLARREVDAYGVVLCVFPISNSTCRFFSCWGPRILCEPFRKVASDPPVVWPAVPAFPVSRAWSTWCVPLAKRFLPSKRNLEKVSGWGFGLRTCKTRPSVYVLQPYYTAKKAK
jgi:hypothetical protein